MEIQNLPQSVQSLMAQAQNAIANADQAAAYGDYNNSRDWANYALSQLTQVAQIIAQSQPQVAGLMMMSQYGFRGIQQTETQEWIETTSTDRYLLGFKVGTEYHTTTRRHTNTKRWDIY